MPCAPAPLLALQDQLTAVGELRSAVREFVDAREWQKFHTAKHLAMSIAIEAAEIMEHFQWTDAAESMERMAADEAERAEVADELADVLIYCLSLANSLGIDASAAVGKKLVRNESRFPVPVVQGRLG